MCVCVCVCVNDSPQTCIKIVKGNSYEQLGRHDECIKCYQRAEVNGDGEGIAIFRLASLFKKLKKNKEAAVQYSKYIDLKDKHANAIKHGTQIANIDDEMNEALLFLANYYFKESKFKIAEKLTNISKTYLCVFCFFECAFAFFICVCVCVFSV